MVNNTQKFNNSDATVVIPLICKTHSLPSPKEPWCTGRSAETGLTRKVVGFFFKAPSHSAEKFSHSHPFFKPQLFTGQLRKDGYLKSPLESPPDMLLIPIS